LSSAAETTSVQTIDLSRMDHLLKGQMTKRFLLAKQQKQPEEIYSKSVVEDEATSLSIIYRDCAKDQLLSMIKRPPHERRMNESLDLIVPDPMDFGHLLTALEDLHAAYRTERIHCDRNVLWLRHYWVDMGKLPEEDMSHAEWLGLCERLNVPLKRSQLSSMYRDFCRNLRKEMEHMEDLPLWAVSELLNDVRFHGMQAAGLKFVNQDPILRLWHDIIGTDPVPSLKITASAGSLELKVDDSNPEKTVSSVAYLSFIRSHQKEFQTTLEDAMELMHILNSQTSVKELAGDPEDPDELSREDRLTKSRFSNFLLSDANDLLDPARGKPGSDDMTHPLSHYWICSSHDTYWNHWTESQDEQSYLAALYRGVRCLELDVWDGVGSEPIPVIAGDKPKAADDPCLELTMVLKAIRQFLLANPKSYPVILNIENHCSFAVQEKLAEQIFQILGSIGLIVVPDDTDSVDEADLLPSPDSMRGKVLVMGKRPRVIEDGAKVINDDFDDENDQYEDDELPNARSREEEEELERGIVIGFDAAGPIKAGRKHEKNIVQHTAGELLYMAKQDLEEAKMNAAQAELKALSASEEADQAEIQSDQQIGEAGLTKEAVLELASQIKGVEIDPVEHVALLTRVEGEGVEIQDFFADAVDGARTSFTKSDQVAIEAASVATVSLQRLNNATLKLREGENLLEESYMKEKKLVEGYQRAATDARAKREDADYATRRVEKVRQLLSGCEDRANTADNVVVTAMTEAKISEKRASETEARAARAAAKAQDDRARGDEESRKEEILEREASSLHEQMSEVADKTKEARDRVEKAAAMLDRVNEQIKLIEQSSQYTRERQDEAGSLEGKKESKTPAKSGKLIAKHNSKMEERRAYTDTMKQASADYNQAEQKRRRVQETFEEKAHMWKNQTEVASKARKVADRSSHAAEELAEHAEEEREAANLRHVAREKAKSNVSEKDSYRGSLKAQVAEAERAAKEAEEKASEARSVADSLEHVNDNLPDHDSVIRILERRKAARDHALEDYEGKKKIKEGADEKASEAKRLFDTSENVYSQAMRSAAKESRKADVQRQADCNAIVAFNQARLARKQAEHALEDALYAQSVVTERQVIIKRANEYKEKTDRVSSIPTSLAKMTFLHTTKHRYWDKSFNLPNTHVHSFAQGVLDQMKQKDPENPYRLKEFTTEHICRTFPSWKDLEGKKVINSDPLMLWALGCQLVSLNYSTFDEHLLKADGRFRRNGSSGYVLKPECLTHDDPLKERQETWNIGILCGSCLPSPESSSKKSGINPFVKLTVHGGDLESKSAEHRTNVVMKNGLNPVWDEKKGFTFTSLNPSMSIIVFTVWNKCENGDEFIAASSMPVSCMREGVRSVALFDMYNTRSGPHAYAALLVKAQKLVI
jgi:hypothetical protein